MLSSKANEKDDKSPDQTSSPKPSDIIEDEERQGSTSGAKSPILRPFFPESSDEIIEDKEMQGSTSAADPSNPLPLSPESSGQVNHQEPAAAQVRYDFLFEEKLSATGVNLKLGVPAAEVGKHFCQLQPGSTREFELKRSNDVHWLTTVWKDYSTENHLQEGNGVFFSKFDTEQPPHYAVQIRRGSSQVGHEEAAGGVKYNYVFKKRLSSRDVINYMTLIKANAEIHFRRDNVPIPDGAMVHVYDINREQTMRWIFLHKNTSFCFNGDWKKYVSDNQLQRGDTVLFYKIGSGQGINSVLQPPYAVQFEKSETRVDMVDVNVPFEKLAV